MTTFLFLFMTTYCKVVVSNLASNSEISFLNSSAMEDIAAISVDVFKPNSDNLSLSAPCNFVVFKLKEKKETY